MSISVIISNPIADEQRQINIPVATESFFREVWLPASLSLNLTMIPMFSFGVDVGEDDLETVLSELNSLKNWIITHNQTAEIHQLQERVDRLITELPKLVSPETKVFIG